MRNRFVPIVLFVVFATLMAAAEVQLHLDKSSYPAGTEVDIHFQGGPGGYMDSIALFEKKSDGWHQSVSNFLWGKRRAR